MSSIINLDNNATTPVDPRVLEEMLPTFSPHCGNPASKTHSLGWYAEELVAIAQERIARCISSSVDEIIFTSGATEANNLAIFGNLRAHRTSSTPIVIAATTIEHHSVLEPLEALRHERIAHIASIPVDSSGIVDRTALNEILKRKPALVAIMLANNEIGSVQPIRELAAEAHRVGAKVLCDATQALGKIPLSFRELDVDFLTLSAHKAYGPKGIGTLIIKKEILSALRPMLFGGGHQQGLRPGTLNVPGIVGFGKACELAEQEFDAQRTKLESLSLTFLTKLQAKIPGLTLNGSSQSRIPGNLNLQFPGLNASQFFGLAGTRIACSASSACTSSRGARSHVLAAIGLSLSEQDCSLRFGIGKQNTIDEISAATEIIAETYFTCRT